jgi:predicted MFS family arabinose efflux permease
VPLATDAGAPRRATYVLGVLALVYAFNHLDRQVFGVLIEPIKADLGLSDSAMGFLGGLSFAFFHAAAGLPIARLADRGSRTRIIAVGIVLWSAATAASGLARSFAHLAVARIVTGIGEASNAPASHSLISDYFPPQRRATALAIFFVGSSVGVALGFLLGGWIAASLGWRWAFFILGAPGVLLALLVRWTVPEPERGAAEAGAVDAGSVSRRSVLEFLRTTRAFPLILLAQAIHAFSGNGLLLWTAPFLMRLHGMEIAETGWVGPIAGISSALGVVSGGRLADHLGSRDARWYLRLPALVALLGLPFTVAFVMSQSVGLALLCLVPHLFLAALPSGPIAAVIQSIVPLRMRAFAAAINLFATNLIGFGLGPQMVSVLSDAFGSVAGNQALRYAMLLVGVANLLAGLFYLLAGRALRLPGRAGD